MPCNLYGPGDHYNPETSHVIPALMRKMHEAKVQGNDQVEVWGSGNPRREFLYSDDVADALVFLFQHYSDEGPVNIGTGSDITIRELAQILQSVVGFEGSLQFNADRPDGIPRKVLNVEKIHTLGWSAKTGLLEGLQKTYTAYCSGEASQKAA